MGLPLTTRSPPYIANITQSIFTKQYSNKSLRQMTQSPTHQIRTRPLCWLSQNITLAWPLFSPLQQFHRYTNRTIRSNVLPARLTTQPLTTRLNHSRAALLPLHFLSTLNSLKPDQLGTVSSSGAMGGRTRSALNLKQWKAFLFTTNGINKSLDLTLELFDLTLFTCPFLNSHPFLLFWFSSDESQ